MNTQTHLVRIRCELTDDQAWQLAQFCKRVGFSDVRANAASDEEAYVMLDAIYRLQRTLAEEGYSPR